MDLKNLDIFRQAGMKVASIGLVTGNQRVPEGRNVPSESDVHAGLMTTSHSPDSSVISAPPPAYWEPPFSGQCAGKSRTR